MTKAAPLESFPVRVSFGEADQASKGDAPIRAPRGSAISCKGWHQEAALRMLINNLDPEVAESPDELIVYGGTGTRRAQLGVLPRHRARARIARQR